MRAICKGMCTENIKANAQVVKMVETIAKQSKQPGNNNNSTLAKQKEKNGTSVEERQTKQRVMLNNNLKDLYTKLSWVDQTI